MAGTIAPRGCMTRVVERRWWLWTLSAASVALVAFGAYAAFAKAAPQPASASGTARPSTSVPVVAAHVRVGDMGVYLTGLGTVTALNTVTVRTQVDGSWWPSRSRKVSWSERSELLAQIDPRPFQVQLAQAEGQAAKDAATLKNAQIDLQRYQVLVEQDAMPKQQLDTQVATVQQLEATLKSDQAQIDSARLNLTYAGSRRRSRAVSACGWSTRATSFTPPIRTALRSSLSVNRSPSSSRFLRTACRTCCGS